MPESKEYNSVGEGGKCLAAFGDLRNLTKLKFDKAHVWFILV